MRLKGTFLVTTVGIMFASRQSATTDRERESWTRRIERVRQTIALARQIGVKIAGGLDAAEADLQGRNARQLISLVQLGVPAIDAIRTETVNAAELLAWSDRIGTLDPGKFADVIAVDGNPMADVRVLERVKFVMKNGSVIENQYKKDSN
jgi:imidazolonepropionase-like amidohydrolase